ncbi:DHS-like NAD/FAD-binding domain-containing protein [Cercophora newfieldiana]|uniref:DHS-like NAD/FAD-binding domain-containing protein n=1 Tax=Cercophora newfieldiana TaxID=92897 RepID=A0AA40CZU4_9PEZI|nr:DHS-like NAD/FAD-binding domain-containing protein [Cercophora newfieldiana]
MAITHVRPDDRLHLQSIASLFVAASKIVTVTGAGISTKAGIPDFRSRNGLYSLGHRRLFHSSVLSGPEGRPLFYSGITKMRKVVKLASPTRTHRFIASLRDAGKLVRDYTQNIDCLEEKAGLSTDLRKGPGSRSRLCRSRPRQVDCEPRLRDRGVECVLLHGSLRRLRCSNCFSTCCWDEDGREAKTLAGQEPPCPGCAELSEARTAAGKRATAIGTLRPDIVLYDEHDPRADSISAIARHDLLQRPDVLLIMGTSLATHGVKHLVRDFAKIVHRRAGKVVFVNLAEPARNWDGVIDYWVEWDCDTWVHDLTNRQPALCSGSMPRVRADSTGDGEHVNAMASPGYDRGQGSSRDNPIDLALS